jgi:hypothetical protein
MLGPLRVVVEGVQLGVDSVGHQLGVVLGSEVQDWVGRDLRSDGVDEPDQVDDGGTVFGAGFCVRPRSTMPGRPRSGCPFKVRDMYSVQTRTGKPPPVIVEERYP